MRLTRLRVYTSVQNLFLVHDKEIIGDPETVPIYGGGDVFSQGMNWSSYPRPRTFMFGIQVGF